MILINVMHVGAWRHYAFHLDFFLRYSFVPNTSATLIICASGKFSLRLISVPVLIPVPLGKLSNY